MRNSHLTGLGVATWRRVMRVRYGQARFVFGVVHWKCLAANMTGEGMRVWTQCLLGRFEAVCQNGTGSSHPSAIILASFNTGAPPPQFNTRTSKVAGRQLPMLEGLHCKRRERHAAANIAKDAHPCIQVSPREYLLERDSLQRPPADWLRLEPAARGGQERPAHQLV